MGFFFLDCNETVKNFKQHRHTHNEKKILLGALLCIFPFLWTKKVFFIFEKNTPGCAFVHFSISWAEKVFFIFEKKYSWCALLCIFFIALNEKKNEFRLRFYHFVSLSCICDWTTVPLSSIFATFLQKKKNHTKIIQNEFSTKKKNKRKKKKDWKKKKTTSLGAPPLPESIGSQKFFFSLWVQQKRKKKTKTKKTERERERERER